MIYSTADVQTKNIGQDSIVWQFAIILPGAIIGNNCNINSHTFIENDVKIGNRVTIRAGVFLRDGIEIGDDVFICPNATFVNDKYPRSKNYLKEFQAIKICKGASIGANPTIIGGITVGVNAMVGAGSVVTKNASVNTLVYGNTAM